MMMNPPPQTVNPSGFVGRKLNVFFCFLLVVTFITSATPLQQLNILVGLILAAAFSLVAFMLRRLTLDGMFAAIVIGVIVLGYGGWPAASVLLLFFISSAVLSGGGEVNSEAAGSSARRSGHQVWANGFWLVTTLMLAVVWNNPLYIVGMLGALATATADTWGTEIGMKFSNTGYLVTNFKKVSAGTDGGVSLQGTLASVMGSAAIAAASIYLFSLNLEVFISIFVAGFLGSVADSYFGAIFQRANSSVALPLFQNTVRIDNNMVNGISTGIGALLAIITNLIIV